MQPRGWTEPDSYRAYRVRAGGRAGGRATTADRLCIWELGDHQEAERRGGTGRRACGPGRTLFLTERV